jgi:hypothetical protein
MSGTISSKPKKDVDWSGKGREVYYAKMDIGTIIHPDNEEIFTTEKLEEAIPGFDWRGGHSGRILDKISAGKLELLWKAYINGNEYMFEKGFAMIDEWTENEAEVIIEDYLRKKHGETCECCGFNYKKVHGRACKGKMDYVRLDAADCDDAEELEASYHALCPNCQRIIETVEETVPKVIETETEVAPVVEEKVKEEAPASKAEESKSKPVTTTQLYGYNHMGMIYEW